MLHTLRNALVVLCLVFGSTAFAQEPSERLWTLLDEVPKADQDHRPWIRPTKFQAARLDLPGLIAHLRLAPMEFTQEGEAAPLTLAIPMPDGSMTAFALVEAPIMEQGLADQFPDIKTFRGTGLIDTYATIRIDYTPQGFHAMIRSPEGDVFIDPYSQGDTTLYSIYYKRDYTSAHDWHCGTETNPIAPAIDLDQPSNPYAPRNANPLRTYRLACAATGEYTAFHGGTVALGQAAIVTAINRVTGVYETELGIRLILVANNSTIVFTNSSTDPYTNGNGGTMLGQNQTRCDSAIGSANYDIGHVFSTGGGGVAGLGVVCSSGNKARGVTGQGTPNGDPFWIDYVAHEMGHQFGGNHTFNSPTSSCSGNRNASTSYEPGSGSTIQAYAGICGADNLQSNSDAYFSFISMQEITTFTTSGGGSACDGNVSTGNTAPTANAGTDFTIPFGTPFTLTGSGADANNDPLTYNWEQRNAGASAFTLASGDPGSGPIMRSWNSSTSPSRTIPRLSNLLANTTAPGEILPDAARTLNFRLTTRDNRSGAGGFGIDDMVVTVANAGPFLVTSPNTAVSWSVGSSQTITWSVANTNIAPVSTANVKISLSTDGGNTFPTVLLATTPNTGTANITVPSAPTTQARIKVEALSNIYFDISNANFTIAGCGAPSIFSQPTAVAACLGEPASFSVGATGTGIAYQWRKNGSNLGGATSSSYSIPSVSAGDLGSYDCVLTGTCGNTTSSAAALTIASAAAITTQPVSQTACSGSSVTFTVIASGSPAPTYQWRRGSSNISGATSPNFTINPVMVASAATYTCVVTNSCGSVTSDGAVLTVRSAPTIFTQPTPRTVCEGSGFSLNVAAGGSPTPTYQWRLDNVAIPGATSNIYTVASATAEMQGSYNCLISNACNTITSNAVSVTVNAAPSFTQQPVAKSHCLGQPFSFTVAIAGTPAPTLQWRHNGNDIPGATSTTYAGTVAEGAGGTYDCVATNSCAVVTSDPATLTVGAAPTIDTDPSPQSVCEGQPATFSVTATGATSYQWRKAGNALTGETSSTLTIAAVTIADQGSYDCLVTNACDSTTSTAADLIINPGATIVDHPISQASCVGASAAFSVTVSGVATYQWRFNSNPIAGATSNTLTIDPVAVSDQGSYDCVVTSDCGTQTTTAATLSVGQAPTITTQPQPLVVAENASASFSVTAAGTDLRYEWRFNGVPLANTAPYSGVDTDTLLISLVTAAEAGGYDCLVTNTCGTIPTTVATLDLVPGCGSSDFDGDGDFGTDADIEAFFACLGGACCPTCFAGGSDFNNDGDSGTDADIEAFFRVLSGQPC